MCGSAGDYESVVREYQRAKTLIRPSSESSRIWVRLYQEIEARVQQVQKQVCALLAQPATPPDVVPACVLFLALLAQEKLAEGGGAGAAGPAGAAAAPEGGSSKAGAALQPPVQDGLLLFLSTMEAHMDGEMRAADAAHDARLQEVRDLFLRDPCRYSSSSTVLQPQLQLHDRGAGAAAAPGSSGGAAPAPFEGADPSFLVWLPSSAEHSPAASSRPGLLPELPDHLAAVVRRGGGEGTGAVGGVLGPGDDMGHGGGWPVVAGLQASRLVGGAALTPAQHSWLVYAGRLSSVVRDGLPGVYSACGSSKYAQVGVCVWGGGVRCRSCCKYAQVCVLGGGVCAYCGSSKHAQVCAMGV